MIATGSANSQSDISNPITRRQALRLGAAALAAGALPIAYGQPASAPQPGNQPSPSPAATSPTFCISQWTFHRTLQSTGPDRMDNLDFAKAAVALGLPGLDYCSMFFQDKVKDTDYLKQMASRAADVNARGGVILVDGAGDVADPDSKKAVAAVDAHKRWLDAAKALGCIGIRLNVRSTGEPDDQRNRFTSGIRRLCAHAKNLSLMVLAENHGALSSNGLWMAELAKAVAHESFGLLADFGNWTIAEGQTYDRYKGLAEMAPHVRHVSCKSYDFDAAGNETTIDYPRAIKIFTDAGYRGWWEVEYEGERLAADQGAKLNKALIERALAAPK